MTRQLLTASQVLPGPRGQQIPDCAVLIDDDTITAVGPRDAVENLAGDAVRHDFPGTTILPGLIDCHVHLVFDPSQDPVTNVHDVADDLLDAMALPFGSATASTQATYPARTITSADALGLRG